MPPHSSSQASPKRTVEQQGLLVLLAHVLRKENSPRTEERRNTKTGHKQWSKKITMTPVDFTPAAGCPELEVNRNLFFSWRTQQVISCILLDSICFVDSDARNIHGTDPQYLIEKSNLSFLFDLSPYSLVLRLKIHDSRYWKEHCFALSGFIPH